MKKTLFIILLTTMLFISSLPISAQNVHWLYNDSTEEINEVLDAVRDYGSSSVPDDLSLITAEDLVRLYKFNDEHLPNVYSENNSLANNVSSEYRYKYFITSSGYALTIMKDENDHWYVVTESNELRVAERNFPDISFLFTDMVENIAETVPEYDPESLRYIEYDALGCMLVYFRDTDTEYIAYYPLYEDEIEELICSKIYTATEFIDIIDDFPTFNVTVPSEGAGGGVGLVNHTKSYNWYVYPAIGISVVLVVSAVGYVIIKRKRAEQ